MRRSTALVLGVLMVALGLANPGPAIAAALFTFRGVVVTSPGASETQIDVVGGSTAGISKIEVTVRKWRSETVGTVDDFELVEGTAADGTWRSRAMLPLTRNNFEADVRAFDLEGNALRPIFGRILLNGPQPEITDFVMGPATVDIDHRDVSFQGRLILRESTGSERPLVGETVCVAVVNSCDVTDDDGRFSGLAPIRQSGSYQVSFQATGDYRAAASPATRIEWMDLKTRIDITGGTTTQAEVGQGGVEGRLMRQSRAGIWSPLPEKYITIRSRDRQSGTQEVTVALTGADGRFEVGVPLPATVAWTASYRGEHGYDLAVTNGVIEAVRTTEFSADTAAPNPVGKGTKLVLSGSLIRRGVSGAQAVVTGGWVDVEFSRDRRRWEQRNSGLTDGQGRFRITATAQADGYWRVRYIPKNNRPEDDNAPEHIRDLGAEGQSIGVDVRHRTAVSSFDAGPEPVRRGKTLTVSGVLKRSSNGTAFKAWSGQLVYVYYCPAGSKTWTYWGSVKTGRYGKFRLSFKAAKDATWKAAYKGDADNLRAESATDYVDVR